LSCASHSSFNSTECAAKVYSALGTMMVNACGCFLSLDWGRSMALLRLMVPFAAGASTSAARHRATSRVCKPFEKYKSDEVRGTRT